MGDAEVIQIEDCTVDDAATPAEQSSATKKSGSGAEMVFENVSVDANGKRILWSVSGKALPGQMLALMGPSGKLQPPPGRRDCFVCRERVWFRQTEKQVMHMRACV